jgi:hypothetical protein
MKRIVSIFALLSGGEGVCKWKDVDHPYVDRRVQDNSRSPIGCSKKPLFLLRSEGLW